MSQIIFIRWCVFLFLTIAPNVNVRADYLWPLPYGKELSSIFGDWRVRRYHAGIDIRTGGQPGRAVVAPGDGYISRVRASYFGYGKALHLQMKDGNSAIFAHLERFHPRIEEFLRKNQIGVESYGQDLYPQKDQFHFARGDTIGWSGQTGAGAPHLHVEIRTPENKTVNPLAFSGLQVRDKQPPVFRKLKLIGRHNEELLRALGYRLEFQFVRDLKQNVYRLKDTVFCDWRTFWLAVEVVDKVGISDWWKSIYSIQLRHQDSVLYELTYDTISFEQSYLIDHERNFREARNGSSDFYNLVSLSQAIGDSSINKILGNGDFALEIVARDMAGNESRALVPIRCDNRSLATPDYDGLETILKDKGRRIGEVLVGQIPSRDGLDILVQDSLGELGSFGFRLGSQPVYNTQELVRLGRGFYLGTAHLWQWDYVRPSRGLADIIIRAARESGNDSTYSLPLDYHRLTSFGDGDSLYLNASEGRFELLIGPADRAFLPVDRYICFKINIDTTVNWMSFTVEPDDLPLATPVTCRYEFYPTAPPRGVGFYHVDRGKPSFIGADIDTIDRSLSAQDYQLGTIALLIDTIPPVITSVSPRNQSSVFTSRPTIAAHISDELSGIRDQIEVRIDGQWCIPIYDPESGKIKSTPHFDLKPGRHRLDIVVGDQIGNQEHHKSSFVFVASRKRK